MCGKVQILKEKSEVKWKKHTMELVANIKLMELKQAEKCTLVGLNRVIDLAEEAVNAELRNDGVYVFGLSVDDAELVGITIPSPEAVVEEKKADAVGVASIDTVDGMAAAYKEEGK